MTLECVPDLQCAIAQSVVEKHELGGAGGPFQGTLHFGIVNARVVDRHGLGIDLATVPLW
jgi:hypothetical protein